ncbi:MAG: hypothetical protein KatS3mg031_0207 [Chitinophagales bacterium]|nr:MAG: hypothetical protein KatS3mg031_0207 [Chitinophagales bacterium]
MSQTTLPLKEEEEKKNKVKGILVTVAVHALIMLLFLYLGLSSKYPPPVEGIVVNFGTLDAGQGPRQPQVIEEKEVSPPEEAEPLPVEEQEEAAPDIVTQQTEEAPAIEKPVEKKEPEKKPEKPKEETPRPVKEPPKEDPKKLVKEEPAPVKEEPRIDPKSLYSGQKASENKPGSEGKTYTPGDQGDPSGDPSAKNYTGESKGLGNIGVGYDLTGRNLLAIPDIDRSYKESGKVVIQIKVDRNGNVVLAKFTLKGSTTTDPTLIALAEKAAREARFSADPNAPEEQFGTISFTFKLK